MKQLINSTHSTFFTSLLLVASCLSVIYAEPDNHYMRYGDARGNTLVVTNISDLATDAQLAEHTTLVQVSPFSDWVCSNPGIQVIWLDEKWTFEGVGYASEPEASDFYATHIELEQLYADRVRNSNVGYQLGSQSNKLLQAAAPLSGKEFDLSNNSGLVFAVSNIIIALGGQFTQPVPPSSNMTTLRYSSNPEGSYLIEGDLSWEDWESLGLMSTEYGPPTFIVQPTEVIIGSAVTSIGPYAFMNCSALTNCVIPNSVNDIAESSFDNCTDNLFDWTIITGVKIIDGWIVGQGAPYGGDLNTGSCRGIAWYAFQSNSDLTSVVFGSTMVNIGDGAFNECINLSTLTIPSSVEKIGNSAFNNCPVTTVYVSTGDTSRIRNLLQNSGLNTTNVTFIEQ